MIVYWTTSKSGKEYEKVHSTMERAEADEWLNNYYLPRIVEENVDAHEFNELTTNEFNQDAECHIFMEYSDLDKHMAFKRGLES